MKIRHAILIPLISLIGMIFILANYENHLAEWEKERAISRRKDSLESIERRITDSLYWAEEWSLKYSWHYDTSRDGLTNKPEYRAILRTYVKPVVGTTTRYHTDVKHTTTTKTTKFRNRKSYIWNGNHRSKGKSTTTASTTISNNSYTEEILGDITLEIRKNIDQSTDVYLAISPGNFISTRALRVSFDHKTVKTFDVQSSADDATLFIRQQKRFLKSLRKADSLFIEATVESGTVIAPFRISGLRKDW